MADFIDENKARQWLRDRDLMPPNTPMPKLAHDKLTGLIRLVRVIHPDLDKDARYRWVNDHIVRFNLADGYSSQEHLAMNYPHEFDSKTFKSVEFNPVMLPLLGQVSRWKEKIDKAEPPNLSLRSLAEEQGIDPDYAVSWMRQTLPKISANAEPTGILWFQPRSSLIRDWHREHPNTTLTDHFIEKLFAEPVGNKNDPSDYLISPLCAELIDLPHIAIAHRIEAELHDYGALGPEDVHKIDRKPTIEVLPTRWQAPPDVLFPRHRLIIRPQLGR